MTWYCQKTFLHLADAFIQSDLKQLIHIDVEATMQGASSSAALRCKRLAQGHFCLPTGIEVKGQGEQVSLGVKASWIRF